MALPPRLREYILRKRGHDVNARRRQLRRPRYCAAIRHTVSEHRKSRLLRNRPSAGKAEKVPEPLRKDSCLLELPAELRNAIYEYAVTDHNDITVTKDTKEPALTQTCKQIRYEARSLWFKKNKFKVALNNYDAIVLSAWSALTACAGVQLNVAITIYGAPNWGNLLSWMHTVWADEKTLFITKVDSMRQEAGVIRAAQDIALELRGSRWERCAQMLEHFRFGIGQYDRRWLH